MSETQRPKSSSSARAASSLAGKRYGRWRIRPHLQGGTLALVDNDPARMDKMGRLARKVVAETGIPLRIEVASDWKEALPGADFVALSFAVDTVRYPRHRLPDQREVRHPHVQRRYDWPRRHLPRHA